MQTVEITNDVRVECVAVFLGVDLHTLFPQTLEQRQIQLWQLQMLRIRPLQGYHLGATIMSDLSMVMVDSHQCEEALQHFVSAQAEEFALTEMQRLLCRGHYRLEERWTGIYLSDPQDARMETVLPDVHFFSVTSGTGMSTAFALGEECLKGERMQW